MSMMQQGSGLSEGKLPIFIFPTNLTFYSDDQSSHKQVLTLYNPYDFTIKFKVLCTTPRKYSVVDAEGIVKSRCCVDIVVRHKDICVNNEGVRDKFRIHAFEHGQKAILGRRDVTCLLLPTKERGGEEVFEHLPSSASSMQRGAEAHSIYGGRTFPGQPPRGTGLPAGPSWVVMLAAIGCILALMLPTTGDSSSSLPSYLHLSMPQKLIAAYILGLVTMTILRS